MVTINSINITTAVISEEMKTINNSYQKLKNKAKQKTQHPPRLKLPIWEKDGPGFRQASGPLGAGETPPPAGRCSHHFGARPESGPVSRVTPARTLARERDRVQGRPWGHKSLALQMKLSRVRVALPAATAGTLPVHATCTHECAHTRTDTTHSVHSTHEHLHVFTPCTQAHTHTCAPMSSHICVHRCTPRL